MESGMIWIREKKRFFIFSQSFPTNANTSYKPGWRGSVWARVEKFHPQLDFVFTEAFFSVCEKWIRVRRHGTFSNRTQIFIFSRSNGTRQVTSWMGKKRFFFTVNKFFSGFFFHSLSNFSAMFEFNFEFQFNYFPVALPWCLIKNHSVGGFLQYFFTFPEFFCGNSFDDYAKKFDGGTFDGWEINLAVEGNMLKGFGV